MGLFISAFLEMSEAVTRQLQKVLLWFSRFFVSDLLLNCFFLIQLNYLLYKMSQYDIHQEVNFNHEAEFKIRESVLFVNNSSLINNHLNLMPFTRAHYGINQQ
jgi:predicted membrane-bound mannosyltransferase